MNWEILNERLNNLEKKIPKQEPLSDDEALDMVFISMYAPKEYARQVTEKIVRLFSSDESITSILGLDIACALSFMVKKNFGSTSKGEELLNMIDEKYLDKSAIRDIIDFEVDFARKSYEKQLEERDNTIAEKDSAIAEKDSAIAEKDNIILKKDEEIASLKAKLNKLNGD